MSYKYNQQHCSHPKVTLALQAAAASILHDCYQPATCLYRARWLADKRVPVWRDFRFPWAEHTWIFTNF